MAVTGASNLLGTRPDLPQLAERVHGVGARLWVDAVHLAAHARLDVAALGADFLVCSPYKFLGPHHGVLVAAPDLLATLRPDKLLPSSDAVPERFELGTLPYELLAGTTAAVDYLAQLGGDGVESGALDQVLRDRCTTTRTNFAVTSKAVWPSSARWSTAGPGSAPRPCSSTCRVIRRPAVASHLAADRINAPAGSFYAIETSRHLGLGDHGAVRVGLAPYSDSRRRGPAARQPASCGPRLHGRPASRRRAQPSPSPAAAPTPIAAPGAPPPVSSGSGGRARIPRLPVRSRCSTALASLVSP